jgi:hypothetical protein
MTSIFILIDVSLSMDMTKMEIIKLVNKYIETHNGKRVSVYFFSHVIEESFENVTRIRESDFEFRGRSAIWDSLEFVFEKANKFYFPIIAILTDGKDTASVCPKPNIRQKLLMGWTFVYLLRDPFYTRYTVCNQISQLLLLHQ